MERKLLKTLPLLLLCLLILQAVANALDAQAMEALKQKVATAHHYPPDKLIVEELPLREIRRDGPPANLLFRARFTARDNSFFPLEIAVGEQELILPTRERGPIEELFARKEAAKQAGAKLPDTNRVSYLEDGGVAYSNLVGVGSGGVSGLFFLLLPGGKLGVAIGWSSPTENPVNPEKAPEKYLHIFSSLESMAEELPVHIQLARDVAVAVAGSSAGGIAPDKEAAPQETTEPATPIPTGPTRSNRPPVAEFPSPWPWLAGGVILLALLIMALMRRK